MILVRYLSVVLSNSHNTIHDFPWFGNFMGTYPIVISSDTYINGTLPNKQPCLRGLLIQGWHYKPTILGYHHDLGNLMKPPYFSIILGKFHHDRSLFSRHLESWWKDSGNHPKMVGQTIQVSEILWPLRRYIIPSGLFKKHRTLMIQIGDYPTGLRDVKQLYKEWICEGMWRNRFTYHTIPMIQIGEHIQQILELVW